MHSVLPRYSSTYILLAVVGHAAAEPQHRPKLRRPRTRLVVSGNMSKLYLAGLAISLAAKLPEQHGKLMPKDGVARGIFLR